MIISVLSGKGGTGKTTIAANLAALINNSTYVDCDVEEPNGFIFLKPEIQQTSNVEVMVPEIDRDRCSGCGKCVQFCYFHALGLVKGSVLVFPEICHGCEGCVLVCPEGAIKKNTRLIGKIEKGYRGDIECIRGVLNIGEPVGIPILKELKKMIGKDGVSVLDCPPGASCSVVNSVEGSDFAVLVTEPTNFGLHDLKIAVELLDRMRIPKGVVINRSGEDDSIIEDFCRKQGIPVLGTIPFDRRIAEAYSRGDLLTERAEFRKMFETLLVNLKGVMAYEAAGNN